MVYKKYYLYKEQYSTDNGQTWLDVEPLTLSPNGAPIDTYNTEEECEGQPTPTGDAKYIAYYSDGTSYSAECDSTSAITQGEIALSDLVSVQIGNCVTSINASALRDCKSLTSVTIPDSVTYIGRVAFNGCYHITHLVIPSSVTSIGEYAFGNCVGLQDITMLGIAPPNLAAGGVFNNTSCPIYVPCGSVDFYKNLNVWSANYRYRIKPWLECGSEEAQYRWYPSGTTCVGYDKWEQSIKQVSYDGGTTWTNIVPSSYGATTLIEANSVDCGFAIKFMATYSNSTTYSAACDSNSSLQTATTRAHSTSYTAMTTAEIGDCVTRISDYAFSECINLTSVTIPNSVTSITLAAFSYCHSLTSVIIPDSVTSLGQSAFYDCSRLTNIDIPSGVTTIGTFAFSGCTSLTSVTIGSGVTSIGNSAFRDCTSLTSVTVNATTPPTLANYAFSNTNNCPIYVPSASVSAYQSAWSAYSSRIQAIPT